NCPGPAAAAHPVVERRAIGMASFERAELLSVPGAPPAGRTDLGAEDGVTEFVIEHRITPAAMLVRNQFLGDIDSPAREVARAEGAPLAAACPAYGVTLQVLTFGKILIDEEAP